MLGNKKKKKKYVKFPDEDEIMEKDEGKSNVAWEMLEILCSPCYRWISSVEVSFGFKINFVTFTSHDYQQKKIFCRSAVWIHRKCWCLF